MPHKYHLITFILSVAVLTGLSNCAERGPHSDIGSKEISIDYAVITGTGPRYYGVEASWIDQDRQLYLDRFRQLHGNVVRVQIAQGFFEPRDNNQIDFSTPLPIDMQSGKTATYEMMFKSLVHEFPDMHFQINIWLAAPWNAAEPKGYLGIGGTFPPRDYAKHREFVRRLADWLVKTCGIAPDHLSFTFINEPNLQSFFTGTQKDLVRMAEETRSALKAVSPAIQMGGLDEVHGTSWTDAFNSKSPRGCCDFWTFHVYEHGLSSVWNALDDRIRKMSAYGPVWVTEFADTANGSPDAKMDFSTKDAALEYADLLAKLWPSGITGIIHFRLSDTFTDRFGLGGWVGHGLFADSRGTHAQGRAYEPYPAYWVVANMYREFGGRRLVQTVAPQGLTVLSAREGNNHEPSLTVWITNTEKQDYATELKVAHFPADKVRVQILDNLNGDQPIAESVASGGDLTVTVQIPRQSSYLYIFSAHN